MIGNLLIVGTGAMACFFAARLASQVEITMLGSWPEGLAALRERGVIFENNESYTVSTLRVTDDPQTCTGIRAALVLVKSWQTERASEQLATCLASDGVALTLQNGLGNLGTLQSALGEARVALGVTHCGATLLGPGHVRLGGDGPTFVAAHPKLDPLIHLLSDAGFSMEVKNDLDGLIWGKLAVNAGINPLTALLRVPNGRLLEDSHAQALMIEAARETASVAHAKGVHLPYTDPARQVMEVAQRTAPNHSSMLQDILRGAPTEIDAISGAISRQGQRLNIPTPINRTLTMLVQAKVALYHKAHP